MLCKRKEIGLACGTTKAGSDKTLVSWRFQIKERTEGDSDGEELLTDLFRPCDFLFQVNLDKSLISP